MSQKQKDAFKSKLASLKIQREQMVELICQLEEFLPEICPDTIEAYLKDSEWLNNNYQKLSDNREPGMDKIKQEVEEQLMFGEELQNLYRNEFCYGQIDFEMFKRKLRELHDQSGFEAQPSRTHGQPTPAGINPNQRQPAGANNNSRANPTTTKPTTGNGDPEDMDEILRQIAALEAAEKQKPIPPGGQANAGPPARGGGASNNADLRRQQDDEDRRRRQREQDEEERRRKLKREQEEEEKRRQALRDEQDRKRRQDEERRQREAADLRRKEEEDRRRNMNGSDRHPPANNRVIQEEPEYSDQDSYQEVGNHHNKPAVDPKKQPNANMIGAGRLIGNNMDSLIKEDDRKKKEANNRDAFGRLIGAGMPDMMNQDNMGKLIGNGVPGMVNKDNMGRLIGSGVPGMLNQDNMGKMIGSGVPGMMNQNGMGKLIGSGMPGMMNQDGMGKLIGSGMPGMMNQNGMGKLIGGGLNGMLNQDGMGKLVGGGLNGMLNMDNFGHMIGGALEGGLTGENVESRLDQERKLELVKTLESSEQVLTKLKAITQQDENKEVGLRDKLSGLKSISTDVKNDVEVARNDMKEKEVRNNMAAKELDLMKKDLNELNKQIDEIKRNSHQRVDANKVLRNERNKHKDQLRKTEVELQTFKSSYESLMKRWQDEIHGHARSSATDFERRPTSYVVPGGVYSRLIREPGQLSRDGYGTPQEGQVSYSGSSDVYVPGRITTTRPADYGETLKSYFPAYQLDGPTLTPGQTSTPVSIGDGNSYASKYLTKIGHY